MRGGNGLDAALLERFLHVPEFREIAAGHDLRLALVADAVAHFVEAVVDEIELEVVVVDAIGLEPKHPHLLELERDAAGGAEVAAVLGKDGTHLGDRPRRVVGGRFDDHRHAMGRVAFVDDGFVSRGILARSTLDGGLDLVLRHVQRAAVLYRAAQRRVGIDVRPTGLDGHVDVFGDARELLGHAVPAREHGVLAYFEYASHRARILAQMGSLPISRKRGQALTGDRRGSAPKVVGFAVGSKNADGMQLAQSREVHSVCSRRPDCYADDLWRAPPPVFSVCAIPSLRTEAPFGYF